MSKADKFTPIIYYAGKAKLVGSPKCGTGTLTVKALLDGNARLQSEWAPYGIPAVTDSTPSQQLSMGERAAKAKRKGKRAIV